MLSPRAPIEVRLPPVVSTRLGATVHWPSARTLVLRWTAVKEARAEFASGKLKPRSAAEVMQLIWP